MAHPNVEASLKQGSVFYTAGSGVLQLQPKKPAARPAFTALVRCRANPHSPPAAIADKSTFLLVLNFRLPDSQLVACWSVPQAQKGRPVGKFVSLRQSGRTPVCKGCRVVGLTAGQTPSEATAPREIENTLCLFRVTAYMLAVRLQLLNT